MSKLNLEDVLFICLGTAEATESALDNWRDAMVLTEADAGGNGAIWVFLEAAEDEVCKLDASFGGASDGDRSGRTVLDEGLLPPCPNCASPFSACLGTLMAS
jgi:hypothetical protein